MAFDDANLKKVSGEMRIGIDAGSKTVKSVVIDERDVIVGCLYERHNLDVRETIARTIRTLSLSNGITEARVAFTGSAAIDLASQLGVPFVQEVIATTGAVEKLVPDADVVIELGGEDSKIIYLSGPEGIEQRMNATCAGGTGSFVETAAHMVGLHTDEVSDLALASHHIYPIASRCAVFAQNDIRPLLNAGVDKADIAASALEAVARQAVSGLACGRPIRGNVVLLGGVIAMNPAARLSFTHVLKDMDARIIVPTRPHLATALGCAMEARTAEKVDLEELNWRIRKTVEFKEDLKRLEPLFENEDELADFKARHSKGHVRLGNYSDARDEVFIGLDAGSTTVKCAVIDKEGNLLSSEYEEAEGDTLEVARDMIAKSLRMISAKTEGSEPLRVGRAVVTGYGEDMLKCGLRFDAGVVETAAHLRAALELRPDATFVLDIGGQDMKALWVRDGVVVDAVLNEACSSGCGAFVGGSARSLKMSQEAFNGVALQAKRPIDLGTKCTVFMTSRVRHAQKVGAEKPDIAAGIAYAVVNNALVRIVGEERASSMGPVAVVQGGTFKSDAVLRAFEKVTGCEVIRPDIAHLMGAYGAALLARDAWVEQRDASGRASVSGLVSAEELMQMDPERRSVRCNGCGNSCQVTLVDFGGGRRFASGNKCDKVFSSTGAASETEWSQVPNMAQIERELLAEYATTESASPRGSVTVGLSNTLDAYEHTPFWHTLLTKLGFSVRMPNGNGYPQLENLAAETVPSESVCSPAKLSHLRYQGLLADGCDVVFMPRYLRGRHCAVSHMYASALRDNVGAERLIAPLLPCKSLHAMLDDTAAQDVLFKELSFLSAAADAFTREEFGEALHAAFGAQADFREKLLGETGRVLEWLAADPSRRAAVLACRPYHIDSAVMHGIDEMLQKLGFAVITPAGIDDSFKPARDGGWDAAFNLRTAIAFADANPQIDVVAIRSFGCGYDAAGFADARRAHSFTELKIDDMVDTSHIKIRLRTLAEMRGLRKGRESALSRDMAEMALTLPDACSTLRELMSRANAGEDVPETCVKCLTYFAEREAGASGQEATKQEAGKPKCSSFIRLLASLVGRKGAETADSAAEEPRVAEAASAEGDVTRIGLIGNPLLVFDEDMNEGIVDMLEGLGCSVVMPEHDLVYVDDVRYLDQLDRFSKAGVDAVIYLQSFGCLKGHVQSRGAAHELAMRYPSMPITIVDYDSDSSALNRENRIRLAVEAAKRHDAARPVRIEPYKRSSSVGSLEEALREYAGKVDPDATTTGKTGNTGGKIFFDTTHRRIVSLVPREEIGGENRLLVEALLEEGFEFDLDSSPRFVAKERESLRK